MKIAVISPHRDDAAFSVGLSINGWLAAGHTVVVMNCFTQSTFAPNSETKSLPPRKRLSYVTSLRLQEDEAWSQLYDPWLTLTDLKMKDAPLRLHCSPSKVCRISPRPKGGIFHRKDIAYATIREALNRVGADALVLPLACGGHVDHITARDAARSFADGAFPIAFYEDLPYVAWAGSSAGIEDTAHALGSHLAPVFATAAVDTDIAMKLKLSYSLCYKSQIDKDVPTQIASFSTRYGGRERLWANPDWRDSNLFAKSLH